MRELNRADILQIIEKRELSEEEKTLLREYEEAIEKFRNCHQELEKSGGTIKQTLKTIEGLISSNKKIAEIRGKFQESGSS